MPLRLLVAAALLAGLESRVVAQSAYRVSENGRHLVDASGEPFFWLGDTAWELFHFLSADDAAALLRARKAQGFTVIQVMVTGVFPEWNIQNQVVAPTDLEAWVDNDPGQPNEAYFERMDAIAAAARREGLLLVLGVYHARDVDAGRVTLANIGPWCRWLARRYREVPNIVWSMYPHAVAESVPMIERAVAALQEGDGGAHLITMHPDPSPTSSSFLHAEPWLAFNTFQSWSSQHLNFELAQKDRAREPVKPVVNGEARYEDEDGTSPLDVRRGAWWSWLAGAFYSYGHRDNWKSPRTWREWIDTPGARQMGVLAKVMRERAWWRLVPDQSLFSAPDESAAARSSDGDWMMVYLPAPQTVRVRLSGITTAPRAQCTWINPADGVQLFAGTFSTDSQPTLSSPANWEDAVLLVEAAP